MSSTKSETVDRWVLNDEDAIRRSDRNRQRTVIAIENDKEDTLKKLKRESAALLKLVDSSHELLAKSESHHELKVHHESLKKQANNVQNLASRYESVVIESKCVVGEEARVSIEALTAYNSISDKILQALCDNKSLLSDSKRSRRSSCRSSRRSERTYVSSGMAQIRAEMAQKEAEMAVQQAEIKNAAIDDDLRRASLDLEERQFELEMKLKEKQVELEMKLKRERLELDEKQNQRAREKALEAATIRVNVFREHFQEHKLASIKNESLSSSQKSSQHNRRLKPSSDVQNSECEKVVSFGNRRITPTFSLNDEAEQNRRLIPALNVQVKNDNCLVCDKQNIPTFSNDKDDFSRLDNEYIQDNTLFKHDNLYSEPIVSCPAVDVGRLMPLSVESRDTHPENGIPALYPAADDRRLKPLSMENRDFLEKPHNLSALSTEYIPKRYMDSREKTTTSTDTEKIETLVSSFGKFCEIQADFSRKICEIQGQQVLATNRASMAKAEPPVFSGDIVDYLSWSSAFQALVDNAGISQTEKLFLLGKYTSGKAHAMVKTYISMGTPTAYEAARKVLSDRFGHPVSLYESFRERLESWPKVNKAKDIQEFYDFVQEMVDAMNGIEYLRVFDNITTIKMMMKKLPPYTYNEWQRSCEALSDGHLSVNLGSFVTFLRRVARRAMDPVFGREALQYEKPSKEDKTTKKSNQAYAVTDQTKAKPEDKTNDCMKCETTKHSLAECTEMLKLPLKEREDYIFTNKLCWKCGKKYHQAKDCWYPKECKKCNKKHMTILHNEGLTEEKEEKPADNETASNSATQEATNFSVLEEGTYTSCCPVLPVYVFSSVNPTERIKTFALIDNGSNVCFVSSDICKRLGVKTNETYLNLTTVHASKTEKINFCQELRCCGVMETEEVELPKAFIKEVLPISNATPCENRLKDLKYLDPVRRYLPHMKPTETLGLIIGTNCPRGVYIKDIINGPSSYPQAIKYALGWTLQGVLPGISFAASQQETLTSFRVAAELKVPTVIDKKEFLCPIKGKEVIEPKYIVDMFQQEYSECGYLEESWSQEDKRFIEVMESSISVDPDNHYILPLPIRNRSYQLPNNKDYVQRRLITLKKKLIKDKNYHEKYTNFVEEMIAEGHAEKVNENCDTSPVWYLPHFGVINPKKPDKLRVVFDCAAKYQGLCLNDVLMSGPDMTNGLVGVLLRFRLHQVAFTADIKGMFHQVRVSPEDRNYLRFLWWKNGQLDLDPEEYRMCVHLFGASSSPSCATFALRQAANNCPQEVLDKIRSTNAIKRNMYVDDMCDGGKTVQEAASLILDVKSICKNGGFQLTKFKSSNAELMEHVPEEDKGLDTETNLENRKEVLLERTLGVQWCIENDCFGFKIIMQDKPLTRRGILSTISSIYDPLGFCAPVVLQGKRILQKICKISADGLDWDEPIPEKELSEWRRWREDIIQLDSIKIERRYVPNGFEVSSVEFHHFGDAAPDLGVGQCSYLKVVNPEGDIHCSFLFGKARVPPLKFVTVPRLELNAAVLAVRVSNMLNKELYNELDGLPIQNYFWSDSKVVLGYIQNDQKRYKIYVANRVQEIRDSSCEKQWNHVVTDQNPADDAARGLGVKQLIKSKYLLGPDFLWQPRSEEPIICDICVEDDDPEIKMALCNFKEHENYILSILSNMSSWTTMVRIVALLLRWKGKFKQPTSNILDADMTGSNGRLMPQSSESRSEANEEVVDTHKVKKYSFTRNGRLISPSEFTEAELIIYKLLQQKYAEISLTGGKKGDALYKLDPFLDESGLIRVGGRLRHAIQPYSLKHPIVLPKCEIVEKLVLHYHQIVQHQGRGITCNEIRQNGLWILGSNRFISRIVANCVICKKLRGKKCMQKMSDLPEDRCFEAPCFTFVGCDFFGPFIVKERRSELKRYGCVFTCMTSRAVHIEVVPTLETDDFIKGLRRFICRRGSVQQIRCDRGSNFVGCSNELRKCLEEMDIKKISEELLKVRCTWVEFKFNSPYSSHMGGVWERMIRTIRSVLNGILSTHSAVLDTDGLTTLMCEVEAIVNSRPITALNDETLIEPLTPNHLLTMKTKVVLSPPGTFTDVETYSRRRWRRIQTLADQFWNRFRLEYMHNLQERQKWVKKENNLNENDIVLLSDENLPRNSWRLGRVVEVLPGQDGLIRKVKLLLSSSAADKNGINKEERSYIERPIHKLVFLCGSNNI